MYTRDYGYSCRSHHKIKMLCKYGKMETLCCETGDPVQAVVQETADVLVK